MIQPAAPQGEQGRKPDHRGERPGEERRQNIFYCDELPAGDLIPVRDKEYDEDEQGCGAQHKAEVEVHQQGIGKGENINKRISIAKYPPQPQHHQRQNRDAGEKVHLEDIRHEEAIQGICA